MKLRKIYKLIPCLCVVGLGMMGLLVINPVCNMVESNEVYAATVSDYPTISLSLDGWWTNGLPAFSPLGKVQYATDTKTAYVNYGVSIDVAHAKSYVVQVTGSGLKNGEDNIALAGANGVRGSELKDNTWGYSWGDIATNNEDLIYYTVPSDVTEGGGLSGGIVESSSTATDSITFEKKLVVAANFGSDLPDGTYHTDLYVSLVVDPATKVTMDSISTMQEMTTEVCTNSAVGDTATLQDTRDGSTYTIAKIKNQTNDNALCWMTQNLRIINKDITNNDSDIHDSFTIPSSSLFGSSTSESNTSKAYYNNNVNYGAYYNWYTATAGTGNSSLANDDAPSSICPKGWRLPEGGNNREFYQLVHELSNADITTAPYNFRYSGQIQDGALVNTDRSGVYWSSTRASNNILYVLTIASYSSETYPQNTFGAWDGCSIRCVAR